MHSEYFLEYCDIILVDVMNDVKVLRAPLGGTFINNTVITFFCTKEINFAHFIQKILILYIYEFCFNIITNNEFMTVVHVFYEHTEYIYIHVYIFEKYVTPGAGPILTRGS